MRAEEIYRARMEAAGSGYIDSAKLAFESLDMAQGPETVYAYHGRVQAAFEIFLAETREAYQALEFARAQVGEYR